MFEPFASSQVRYWQRQTRQGCAAESILTREDFACAASEITAWRGYEPTPLYDLKTLAKKLEIKQIFYKDEAPRFGLDSFKALGGAYAALRVLQREIGKRLGHPVFLADIRSKKYHELAAKCKLVSATDGNHGRSLAWGASWLGAGCNIYIHRDVSAGRAAAIEQYGANIVRVDGNYDQTVDAVRRDAAANGWFVVSDTSWDGYSEIPADVMAGYGVMAREICDAFAEPPSHVFLQGGVGGLAAAVCASFRQQWGKRSPRVVIVEPELAACLYESAKADRVQSVDLTEETVMAGLSCGEPSPLAWQILSEEAADFITIPDCLVAPAMRLLARPLGKDPVIVAGESAVAGLAAVIAVATSPNLRTVLGFDHTATPLVIGSEGASDPEIYARIIADT